MSDTVRVAVVGAGIGRQHLAAYRSLSDLFEVSAFCDIDAARAAATAAEFAVKRVLTDFDALCQIEEVEVIDLCTPPWLHVEMALAALAAGKHVICEKPIGASLADVDRLAAAERAHSRHLMPIFNYRFGHGAQKLRRLIERGVTGRAYLTTVETAWRRRPDYYAVPWRGKWRTELGGAIVGHAIHAHDLLLYLLGPARSVFARLGTFVNPIEVEDSASISLEMADGSFASLSVTLGSTAEISRHRFCFANLVAESNTVAYTNTSDPWQFIGDTSAIGAEIEEALADFVPQPEGFAGQFARFHRALQTNEELPVTLADARAALELITACYASSAAGLPISLPLGNDHPAYGGWQPTRRETPS